MARRPTARPLPRHGRQRSGPSRRSQHMIRSNRRTRRVVSRTTSMTLAAIALLGGASAAWVGGCAVDPSEPAAVDQTGSVGLQLQLAFGMTLNTVSYTITGPAGFTRAGTVDVSNSSTLSVVIGGIPFGTGYQISLHGT